MTDREESASGMERSELDHRFTDLYRTNLKDVYSYAFYRIGNHHDAEDITEQTFLQAYRHFERALAESDGRPLRPWLIRIAQNLAANYHRDRSRHPESSLQDEGYLPSQQQTAHLAAEREELGIIIRLIDGMEGERREALIMRFALGMSNREIAQATGRSMGATKVLLHRAVKQLEKEMEDQ